MRPAALRFAQAASGAWLLLASLQACRATVPPTLRLVDRFNADAVVGREDKPPAELPRVEWRFDGSAEDPAKRTRGWSAVADIKDLGVRGGRLAGRAAGKSPILHVEREPSRDPDLLHAIEVRLRVSAGQNMAVAFSDDEKPDLDRARQQARDYPTEGSTPIVAGEEARTYSFRRPETFSSSEIRHIFLRPTDSAGATFEIESIRLVFRKEHLATVPSGVSWQGLSGVFRETLVARSPETARFQLTLPSRPWLDLAVGTIEDGPVTFRVAFETQGGAPATVLERTVTKPHRWEETPLDLAGFAGRQVVLSLSVSTARDGAIGMWGSPVIRSRAALPLRTIETGAGPEPPRGIVILWADTLRADHLEAYGYGRETAPVLKRMAEQGTLFENCITQATWTKVSTPSLMTSLYPTAHGVSKWDDRIPSSVTTLAEAYRDAGYATLSFASNNFTGQLTNLHQGFEQVFEDASLPERNTSKTARAGMDVVLPWLETHRDSPFFVFMSVLDPHDPFKPYAPYDTMWADPANAKEHERQLEQARKFIAIPFLKRFGMPTREELVKARIDPAAFIAHVRDWYDGSIRGMDAELGRLLERLHALGLAERTLVVFTSDHGEEFLEHGRTFHGQSAYGELSRVPLVLWGPGYAPAGRRLEQPVETVDIMPTLLEISRLRAPAEMQGRSLAALLAGEDWTSRPVITEKIRDETELPPLDTDSVAIVADGWKLIHNTRRHPPRPEFELYDFAKDPFDATDLAGQHPDVVDKLSRELAAWRRKAEAGRAKPDSETAATVSGEELERLRALGYVQ
jgi:arylsulfatase A-like enzyme